jgi:hypothetical protein
MHLEPLLYVRNVSRDEIVEHHDLVVGSTQQLMGEVATDESSAARDERSAHDVAIIQISRITSGSRPLAGQLAHGVVSCPRRPPGERRSFQMSSRGKLLLLILLAVSATSMAAASTAVAVEEQPHYIKGGKELTEELKGKGTIGEFFIEVPHFVSSKPFTVLCKGIDSKVGIGSKWKSKLTIEFTECSVKEEGKEIPECDVKEPISVKMLDQLVYKKGKKGEEILDIFFPEEGKKFTGSTLAKLTLTGAGCGVLEGMYKAEGSAIMVPSPDKPGEEAEKIKLTSEGSEAPTGKYFNHETSTEETAGALKFGGDQAFLKGKIEQELESKEKYGAD